MKNDFKMLNWSISFVSNLSANMNYIDKKFLTKILFYYRYL